MDNTKIIEKEAEQNPGDENKENKSINLKKDINKMTPEEKNTYIDLKKSLKTWDLQSSVLRALHIILGILAIFSSLIVASKVTFFFSTEVYAFIAALSIGLSNGFDLGSKANRTRKAWRQLNTAIFSYELNPNYTIDELIKAYYDAETIIGDVKENPK